MIKAKINAETEYLNGNVSRETLNRLLSESLVENVIQTLKCVFLFIRKHQIIILKAKKDIYYNPDKPSSNVSFSLKASLCYWKYSCMESETMSILIVYKVTCF